MTVLRLVDTNMESNKTTKTLCRELKGIVFTNRKIKGIQNFLSLNYPRKNVEVKFEVFRGKSRFFEVLPQIRSNLK